MSKYNRNIKKKRKAFIKKVKKESRGKYKSVPMTCNICKVKLLIHTNTPELYTKEVFENCVCVICKGTWKHRLYKKGLWK